MPHGDGLVAFEVASRLAARGHDVHVMSPSIVLEGSVPANLHVHPLARPPGRGVRGRLAYLPHVRATYRRLRRAAPFDVIHQLNPVFAGISLALAGSRVPVVLGAYVAPWPKEADSANIMGATALPFAAHVRRGVSALQQRLAAALILSTPGAGALVVEPRRSRDKIYSIPHGIDPAVYAEPAADVKLSTADGDAMPSILFVGGTERRKGIYDLLAAFRTVRDALPHARLVIAGAGGREEEVAAAVAVMPERAGIHLLGAVPRTAVPGLMRAATVFAAPSYGEPFGMSLLEAMASAKPVVVTDAGGPAYIVDAAGGAKVPVGDPAALAAALLDILRSPEKAAAMGRYNREKVETTYAWERVVDRIEDVYARAIAARSRA